MEAIISEQNTVSEQRVSGTIFAMASAPLTYPIFPK